MEKRRKFTREFKLEASTFGWCYQIATIVFLSPVLPNYPVYSWSVRHYGDFGF